MSGGWRVCAATKTRREDRWAYILDILFSLRLQCIRLSLVQSGITLYWAIQEATHHSALSPPKKSNVRVRSRPDRRAR